MACYKRLAVCRPNVPGAYYTSSLQYPAFAWNHPPCDLHDRLLPHDHLYHPRTFRNSPICEEPRRSLAGGWGSVGWTIFCKEDCCNASQPHMESLRDPRRLHHRLHGHHPPHAAGHTRIGGARKDGVGFRSRVHIPTSGALPVRGRHDLLRPQHQPRWAGVDGRARVGVGGHQTIRHSSPREEDDGHFGLDFRHRVRLQHLHCPSHTHARPPMDTTHRHCPQRRPREPHALVCDHHDHRLVLLV